MSDNKSTLDELFEDGRAIDEALKALVMSQRIDEYITPIGRKYGKRSPENGMSNGLGSLLWEHDDTIDHAEDD